MLLFTFQCSHRRALHPHRETVRHNRTYTHRHSPAVRGQRMNNFHFTIEINAECAPLATGNSSNQQHRWQHGRLWDVHEKKTKRCVDVPAVRTYWLLTRGKCGTSSPFLSVLNLTNCNLCGKQHLIHFLFCIQLKHKYWMFLMSVAWGTCATTISSQVHSQKPQVHF